MLPMTHSSMFDRFRQGGEDRKKAIEQLYTSYSAPLRLYVISHFRSLADDVDDLLHEFFLRKAMRGALIEGYHPSPGQRFRHRLLAALRNYCRDILKTRKRSGIVFEINEDVDSPLEAEADDFDLLWARQVLGRGIRRMKRECESQDQGPVWASSRAVSWIPFVISQPRPILSWLRGTVFQVPVRRKRQQPKVSGCSPQQCTPQPRNTQAVMMRRRRSVTCGASSTGSGRLVEENRQTKMAMTTPHKE
jgi:DNA-directed RNA polymerase specialized sigma24 family protein